MVVNKFYFTILMIALILLLGYLTYQVLQPFLVPIAWAAVFSVLFYPLYAVILRVVRWPFVASLIVLILILGVVIGPFTYFSFLLVKELGSLVEQVRSQNFALQNILNHPAVQATAGKIISSLNLNPEELNRAVGEQASRWGMEIIGQITSGIRNVLTAALNFLIMALAIFFFLQEGPGFFEKIHQYLPFSGEQKGKLEKQARDILISTIYGGVIVALAQGTVGGVVFFFLGISSSVLWGFAMAIASFLPLVGPFIVWVPASLYLYFQGEVGKAVVLAIIGAAGISLIDNFLRPLIIGQRTRMPFLLVFFSVLGGIRLFGLIGFIMGPMVLALFMSILEIFRAMGEENPP